MIKRPTPSSAIGFQNQKGPKTIHDRELLCTTPNFVPVPGNAAVPTPTLDFMAEGADGAVPNFNNGRRSITDCAKSWELLRGRLCPTSLMVRCYICPKISVGVNVNLLRGEVPPLASPSSVWWQGNDGLEAIRFSRSSYLVAFRPS